MIINPIIPIWLMAIICAACLLLKRKGAAPYIRQIIAVALLFIVNLRIMVPDENATYQKPEIDMNVVFVIDNTLSMVAQDYNGNAQRLDGVKEDCAKLIDDFEGARFSVVTFDNAAHLLMPFSNDEQFVRNSVNSIAPLNSMYARGSSLNMWYDITLEQCKQAKENGGKAAVFFISDGENTSGETIKSFNELSKYIDVGAVLGYGTSKGGIMEVDDWENGKPETVKDPEDFVTDAVSKIDESNLKQIARDLDVSYVNMNTKDGLDQVVKNVLKDAKRTNTDKKAAGYKDIYFVFVIPFLLLLIFEYRYLFMTKARH